MSRWPARETVAFAVALAAIATLGGVAAASVASAAPAATAPPDAPAAPAGPASPDTLAAPAAPAMSDADAAPNATIEYDGDRLVVERATDQRIAGTTTLENGSQVTVRVRSTDSTNPFLRQTVATVDEDGSFATSVDFDNVDRGTEFSVSVRYNGTELATAPGVVGACDPACGDAADDASFDRNIWQTTAGETVELTVTVTDRESAFVRIGEDDTGVTVPFTVTDGNGDGTVTVAFQTGVDAADDPGVSAVASADSVQVHDGLDRPRTLDPADYDIGLYPSADASQGEGYDVATLVVTEPTDDPATTRGGDSTTAGTIYGSASTSTPGGDGGVSVETMSVLAVGGILAIIGIVALVGGLN